MLDSSSSHLKNAIAGLEKHLDDLEKDKETYVKKVDEEIDSLSRALGLMQRRLNSKALSAPVAVPLPRGRKKLAKKRTATKIPSAKSKLGKLYRYLKKNGPLHLRELNAYNEKYLKAKGSVSVILTILKKKGLVVNGVRKKGKGVEKGYWTVTVQ